MLPVGNSRTPTSIALLTALLLVAAPAIAEVIYVENGGVIVGEAEIFSSRSGSVKFWESIPYDFPNGSNNGPTNYRNARGAAFVEVLPDANSGAGVGPTSDTLIDYTLRISTPGEYRLYTRWVGHNGQSDSIFYQIVELADGTGGGGGPNADWYEDAGRGDANFDVNTGSRWDGSGGFEQNQAGTNPTVPMTWQITAPGDYTLRVRPREDGVSFDAFVFQLSAMSAPDRSIARSSIVGELEAPVTMQAILTDDAYVRRGNATTNYGGASSVLVKNNGTSGTTRKGYVKFDLPAFPVDLLLDAELAFQVSGSNTGGSNPQPTSQIANVFGLVEDVDHTWDEATLVWNGSPGNDVNSGGGDPLLGAAGTNADAIFLGQLLIPGVDPTTEDIFVSLSDLDTNGALLDFLAADTDGEVSFLLTRLDSNGSWNLGFASKEHPTMEPPSLTLFIAVPEPGSLALLGIGLAALSRRRRK